MWGSLKPKPWLFGDFWKVVEPTLGVLSPPRERGRKLPGVRSATLGRQLLRVVYQYPPGIKEEVEVRAADLAALTSSFLSLIFISIQPLR